MQLIRRLSPGQQRLAALLLALLGLAGLWAATRAQPPRPARAADLPGLGPLADVRLSGVALAPMQLDPDSGALAFHLQDESGTARVIIPARLARALAAAGNLPAPGDLLTLRGSLRLRADVPSLTLSRPTDLSLVRPVPRSVTLAALVDVRPGQRVEVLAQVLRVQLTPDGGTLLLLRDPSGQAEAVFEPAARQLSRDLPDLQPGTVVRLTGVVDPRPAVPRLSLFSTADVAVLAPDTPLSRPPDSLIPLGQVRAGEMARVAGRVAAVTSLSGGFQFELEDSTGRLALFLPARLYRDVDSRSELRLGAQVEAAGRVELTDDLASLRPARAADLRLLAPAPSPTSTAPLEQLHLSRVGQVITVEAEVLDAQAFEFGLRLTLAQGPAALQVLIWANVLEHTPQAERLVPGQVVRITGLLAQSEGQLELIPQLGYDIEVP